jgi:hypothetical protein
MEAEPPIAHPTEREFAAERSHREDQYAFDANRAAAQSALLVNGGAATAILAYLSKEHVPLDFMHAAAMALIGYGAGVFVAMAMMLCSARSISQWANYWEGHVRSYGEERVRRAERKGRAWLWATYVCFVISISFFLIASAWMGISLYDAKVCSS